MHLVWLQVKVTGVQESNNIIQQLIACSVPYLYADINYFNMMNVIMYSTFSFPYLQTGQFATMLSYAREQLQVGCLKYM